MKNVICTLIGVLGSGLAYLFGGWDAALITLVIVMSIDFVSGLVVGGVFKKSPKTANGALESMACFKGLCRKCMIFCYVLVATRLDLTMGSNFIRNAVIIGFIVNETISITENAGIMGLPVPKVIINAIDVLKNKSEDNA